MRGLTWPVAAKIKEWTFSILAHSRGDTGASGHFAFDRGGGARWTGRISIPPMQSSDAVAFRAFLHALRGRSGTFGFTMPRRPRVDSCRAVRIAGYGDYDDYSIFSDATSFDGGNVLFTDCTKFSDGTRFADSWTDVFVLSGTLTSAAAAGASTVSVSTATEMQVGDFMVIAGQLLRVVSVSGLTAGIRPRLRAAAASGAAFSAGNVSAEFRLTLDAPIVPLIVQRSLDVSLDIEEAY